MNHQRTLPFGILFGLLVCATGWASAEDLDRRFLDGLRQRRLFVLAEHFCEERLQRPKLTETEIVDWTVELVRLYAEHAIQSPPDRRDELVARSRQVATEFGRKHKDHPRSTLVRMQDALTILALAELERQEAEVAAGGHVSYDAARQSTRTALRLLDQLEKDVVELGVLRNRKPAAGDELTAEEILSLHNHTRYQLARAHRNLALTYPAGTEDRISALSQSVTQVDQILKQFSGDDLLAWQIRIDQISGLRLLERTADAQTQFAAVDWKAAPPAIQLAARAEAIRLQLAANNLEEAQKLVAVGRQLAGVHSAELDFAFLETYLALWQKDREANPDRAADWQRLAVDTVLLIDHTHGPYWRHRGDQLLVRSAAGANGTGNVAIVARTADNLFLEGQYEAAVAAYDQALGMLGPGQESLRFDLAYKAALIQQKRRKPEDASQRLRTLSLALKSHPKACDAHLLAAWNLAQRARDDDSLLEQYAEWLVEHLNHWPRAPTANQARVWLGAYYEAERQWKRAIDAYQGVDPASAQFEGAVRALEPCWLRYLAEIKSAGQPTDRDAELGASWFEKWIPGDPGSGAWTAAQQAAILAAARIRIQFSRTGFSAAESLLRSALERNPDAAESWTSQGRSLLVLALAGQADRLDDALNVLKSIGGDAHEPIWRTLVAVSQWADNAPAASRVSLAKLQLAAVEMLGSKREQLSKADQTQLELIRATALSASGRRAEALQAYQQLVPAHPNDGQIQEAYAELLLAGEDKASWRQALDQWRKVASRSPPRSTRWWRAKYSVALAQINLGETQPASQLIRFLQETPPGIEDPQWRAKFDELLKRCP